MRACLDAGRALDALLRVYNRNDAFQVTEDIIGTGVDAFTAILAGRIGVSIMGLRKKINF